MLPAFITPTSSHRSGAGVWYAGSVRSLLSPFVMYLVATSWACQLGVFAPSLAGQCHESRSRPLLACTIVLYIHTGEARLGSRSQTLRCPATVTSSGHLFLCLEQVFMLGEILFFH